MALGKEAWSEARSLLSTILSALSFGPGCDVSYGGVNVQLPGYRSITQPFEIM